MRLIEALEIINHKPGGVSGEFRLFLGCGFTALHLGTFLHARTAAAFPDRNVVLETGLYGDLAGNIDRARSLDIDAAAVVIEWPDIDQRLGIRQLGGWSPEATKDIVESAGHSLARLEAGMAALAAKVPVAVCPPTLPLPPFSHEPGWQTGPAEMQLRAAVADFLARVAQQEHIRVASPQAIDRLTPLAGRFDVRMELSAGFPYTVEHADSIASLLVRLVRNTAPKKGLITDLDDTVWRGILGEVGVNGVSWDLAQKAHAHGLYQQFLAALSRRGTMVAAVSKNDPALVNETFRERDDLLMRESDLYPIEAGWGRKSEAVGRVLRAWNVSADAVVFVDDSPLELEEVKSSHPAMETFLFPTKDPVALWELLQQLQDLFGKGALLDEDLLRLKSLRSTAEFSRAGVPGGPTEDEFLQGVQAHITVECGAGAADARTLELLNKTNQFNLNGRRFSEGDWLEHLRHPDTFLFVVSYRDKFGPLGKIAVMTGRKNGSILNVTAWVMSCRAFARRIEHRLLQILFECYGAPEVVFDYTPTPRNGPTTEFLASALGRPPEECVHLAREQFERTCPRLFHTVERSAHE